MAQRGRVLAFGRVLLKQGYTSKPIESERNRLSCADRVLNYEQNWQPFLMLTPYAAVSLDADRGAWFSAEVCALAIVTTARQPQRVFCHDSDKGTAVASLVIAFRAVSFLKLSQR
jgi:hypothetical protein